MRAVFGRKPSSVRKPSTGPGFRPIVEGLEARDCPALFVWTGKYGSAYGYPTPEGTGGNWLSGSDWYSLSVPSSPPGIPDDVWYDPDYVQGNANCQWGPGASTVKSLHIVKGGGGADYPGAVQIGGLTLSNGLELRSGAIAQGPGTTLTVTRDNPNTVSLWDGGVLNNAAGLAYVTFSNTPVTIDPTAGALTHGSEIKADNNAAVTVLDGTVQTNKDVQIIVTGGATLKANAVSFVVNLVGVIKPIKVTGGATAELKGTFSTRGLLVDGGTAKILGLNKTTKFTREHTVAGSSVVVQSGALVVGNGSTLDAVGKKVSVTGGKLATQAVAAGPQIAAIIKTPELKVSGGDVTISDTAYNPPGDTNHYFGRLYIDGDITWTGGTYRPVVDAQDAANKDMWSCTGVFRVDGRGANGAKLAPGSVNNPPVGAPPAFRSYKVMQADGKIWRAAAGSEPTFENPATTPWQLDAVDGAEFWYVERQF